MAGELNDNLDSNQVIKKIYEHGNVNEANNPNLIRVRDLGGKLVPEVFDEYFVTMADINQISTIVFYLDSNLLVTLAFEYYPNDTFKRAYRL